MGLWGSAQAAARHQPSPKRLGSHAGAAAKTKAAEAKSSNAQRAAAKDALAPDLGRRRRRRIAVRASTQGRPSPTAASLLRRGTDSLVQSALGNAVGRSI